MVKLWKINVDPRIEYANNRDGAPVGKQILVLSPEYFNERT